MARPRGSTKQRQADKRLATGAGRLIGYIRVSTVEQGAHGHSLAGQRTRLEQAAQAQGYTLLEIVEEVESGAKEREGLAEACARIEAGEAEGLLFPKLDRVGRSLVHLARLVEWARERGVTLLSSDEGLMVERGELRNEALPFLQALAQVERERISRRTKEGLAAARERGVKLGRPAENVGAPVQRAVELRRQGHTIAQVVETLAAEGYRTARGGVFHASTVFRMISREDPGANPPGGYRGNALVAAPA